MAYLYGNPDVPGPVPDAPMGEISVEGNATETTITSSSTDFTNKVQITVFDTNGISNPGVTPDHTNDHITVESGSDGNYEIAASVSFSGGANDIYSLAVFINNGATQIGERVTRKLGTGGDVGVAAWTTIAALSGNDTVELWIQNESATDNVTIEDAMLCVVMVD